MEVPEPEALVVTHWFDSGEAGAPYSATVRFTGRRAGVRGNPKARDTVVHDEVIEDILPGTGPISVTAWIYHLEPGEWTVTSELIRISDGARSKASVGSRPRGVRPVQPAAWSWRRWAVSTGPSGPVKTRWAPLAPIARIPAIIPGIYTVLAVLGIAVALASQAAILAGENAAVGRSLTASLIATVSGLIGAKVWYTILHPDAPLIPGGWAVDGFLIIAPLIAAGTLLAIGTPIGVVFDAATPGLFFAVAIGRVGCFFSGCCAGRCSDSRWAVWSSDRRIGARRIPTQLIESGAGLLISLLSLLLVLGLAPSVHGLVFVIAFAAYAIVRQALLRLRAEQRRARGSLPLTAAAGTVVAIVVAGLSLSQTL